MLASLITTAVPSLEVLLKYCQALRTRGLSPLPVPHRVWKCCRSDRLEKVTDHSPSLKPMLADRLKIDL